jgi:thiaminase
MVSDVLHIMSGLRSMGMSKATGRLTSIFDISTRYESQFWDMVYATPPGGDA